MRTSIVRERLAVHFAQLSKMPELFLSARVLVGSTADWMVGWLLLMVAGWLLLLMDGGVAAAAAAVMECLLAGFVRCPTARLA